MSDPTRLKVLIYVVAYNAAKTIVGVLQRIPASLAERYQVTVLVADDCSKDATVAIARDYFEKGYWCEVLAIRNPINQGYGGNQKIGYRYAMDRLFEAVVLLHGDGQYAPECIPMLLEPMATDDTVGAVFGSRMLNKRDALRGGMPLYKFVGNQVLTRFQNLVLGSNLSEFHTGYRVYSVNALRKLPLALNTNDFHFDTEIIVQILFSGAAVRELPIPTHYGDEVCHVDGMRYAWDVVKASIKARLVRLGVFFDPKYAVDGGNDANYVSKFEFHSTHSVALSHIPNGSVVLDLGCADGYLSEKLHQNKNCQIFSVDVDLNKTVQGCHYIQCDLNRSLPDVAWDSIDRIVLLDVIEHLNKPEKFLEDLRYKLSGNSKVKIVVSSGNVCFFVTRIMMFLGQFNYGRRGILDITHTRLFTVASLERILRYAAYSIERRDYIPAPYPLAIGLNWVSRSMIITNKVLARIMPGLFAYQAMYVITPRASTEWLLEQALMATNVQQGELKQNPLSKFEEWVEQ